MTDRLRTVDQSEDVARSSGGADLRHRHDDAELRGNVRNVDGSRAGRDGVGKDAYDRLGIRRRCADRELAQDDALAFFAQLPRTFVADVLLIGHQNLIARTKIKAVGDEVRAHRGVLSERDLAGLRVEQWSELHPQLV